MSIAITGLGAISACGSNIKETLESFSLAKRNAHSLTLFKSDLKCPVFEVENLKIYDSGAMRTLNLALHAGEEAINQAGLNNFSGYRVGICLGTTVASQLNDIDFYSAYREKGEANLDSVDKFINGNLAERISKYFNINTNLFCTIVNACSSGTDAIGIGLSWLRNNYCDIAICGGADE